MTNENEVLTVEYWTPSGHGWIIEKTEPVNHPQGAGFNRFLTVFEALTASTNTGFAYRVMRGDELIAYFDTCEDHLITRGENTDILNMPGKSL